MAVLYRYTDYHGAVLLEKFRISKNTPKGVWIELGGWPVEKKFVLLSGRKRYAYPTEAEALESYIQRKEWHLVHLERRRKQTECSLANAKAGQIGYSFQLREQYMTFDV